MTYFSPLEYFKRNIEDGTKREKILEHISRVYAPRDIYQNYLFQKFSQSYESIWHFKKRFTTQLAASSMFIHTFSLDKQNGCRFYISPSTAQIQFLSIFPRYSEGKIRETTENIPVPFILTENVKLFIGSVSLTGFFNSVLSTSYLCLAQQTNNCLLNDRLRLFFRDDFNDRLDPDENQSKRITDIEESIEFIDQKIKTLSPPTSVEIDPVKPINSKITELIGSSLDPSNISQISPSFCVWF